MYYNILQKENNPLLIDMTRQRYIDMGGIRLMALPGYNLPEYIAKDGFLFGDDELYALQEYAKTNKKKILLSHQLPRGAFIDIVFSGEHVGDAGLADTLQQNNIDILVSGHIHESGGVAETRDGIFIPRNTYAETLYLNAGSVASWQRLNRTPYKGMAAILTVDREHAMYEIVNMP